MTDDGASQHPPPDRRTRLLAVLVAVASGLAWAAAHPAPEIWWLVFAVVPGWLTAVHLVRGGRTATVASVGFVLGVAGFLPMLSWLRHIPGGTFAWPALALVLALYVAAASVVVRRWTTSRWIAVVGPVVWTGMEVARSRFPLGGFGWGDLASAHTTESWMLTVARVLGGDGLTLMTALLGACAWATVVAGLAARGEVEVPEGRSVVTGAARATALADEVRPLLVATVGVAILGILVTADPPPVVDTRDVLVVQGNDGRARGSGAALDRAIVETHAEATLEAVQDGGPPDLTVWAENAIDRDPTEPEGAELQAVVERTVAALDGPLLAGTIRDGSEPRTVRNTVTAYGEGARTLGVYDKQRVVLFGEYVPLRPLLGDIPILRRYRPTDTVPGEGPETLGVAGIRVAPIICFETLFGSIVRDAVADDDAGLVVAVTNDTRFGRSQESAQHVAQSRLRAIETGRAVVHAAISGTSAFVTPDGTVSELAPMFEVTTIRTDVPIVSGTTPAMVVATPLSWLLLVLALGLTVHAAGRTVLDRRRDVGGLER